MGKRPTKKKKRQGKSTRSRTFQSNKKSPFKKWNIQTRLTIISLIFTLIVGIWVPLYINNSNQQLQDKLVSTLSKLQSQNASANLELRSTCSSDPSCTDFEVINLGPGVAKNLTGTISLISPQGIWKSLIQDMRQFTLQTIPFALPVTINAVGSNMLTLSLDNLPPGAAFQFEIKPVNALISSWLTINDKELSASTNFSDYVSSHGLTHSGVDFDMNVRCDTCIGMKRRLSVSFSPLSSWMKASSSFPGIYQSFLDLLASQQYQRAYSLLGSDLQTTTPFPTFLQDMNSVNVIFTPKCGLDRSTFIPQEDAVTWQAQSDFQCSPSHTTQTDFTQQSYDWTVQMRMEAGRPAIFNIDITDNMLTGSGP